MLEQRADHGLDLGADVLKVPHHGEATSVAEFDAVAAPVAVVSVGENSYGHPSTLDALIEAGSAVWRTDERGTITITFDEGTPVVSGER